MMRMIGSKSGTGVCCSVLQRVAACCSVLQLVALAGGAYDWLQEWHGEILLCVAVCCSMLRLRVMRMIGSKNVAGVCCSVLQCVAPAGEACVWLQEWHGGVLQCVAACFSVLCLLVMRMIGSRNGTGVYCSVLQCVAVFVECVALRLLVMRMIGSKNGTGVYCSMLQRVAVLCSVLHLLVMYMIGSKNGTGVNCSVLQCVAPTS